MFEVLNCTSWRTKPLLKLAADPPGLLAEVLTSGLPEAWPGSRRGARALSVEESRIMSSMADVCGSVFCSSLI